MNHVLCPLKPGGPSGPNKTVIPVWISWVIFFLLITSTNRANAQTIPSSVTVSGACLNGSYVLSKFMDNYESTGRPAYRGTGSVTLDSKAYDGISLTLSYVSSKSTWVLSFDGQPYQANASTATLPPMTGWTAVVGDGTMGTCSGSSPLTVNYTTPTVRVALSATSVCAGSPFSLTATAANFSTPVTSYTVSSNPGGITRSNNTGVFTMNAPSVSTATTFTLLVGATNSSESASTTAVVTINPAPTFSNVNTTSSTRCDVPNGRITFTTNLPNGTYSSAYRYNGSAVTQTVQVAGGVLSLTGLSGGSFYGFTIANGGCTGTSSATVSLAGPTPPQVSITPSTTAICAGQSAQLTASGAATYLWSNQLTTATISVSATGTYSVTGTASNGCSGTATASVTVTNPFTANLTNSGPLSCVRNSVTLTTTGGPTGATYTYSSGAQTSSASSATATVSQAGPYSVTVTAPGGCSATATTIVSSNTLAPSVSINPVSQTICSGQSAAFMASGADSYLWSTGATTASISVSVAGPYSVTGVASNGCSNMATATLTVNPLPAAPQVTNTTYCQNQSGQPLSATASPGAILRYYTSSSGGTGYSSITPSTATPNVTTYYVSQLSNGCESMRAPLTVTVNPLPSAPTLVTQSGYAYPAGVSSLTLSQNVGPVSLTASGCSGGMLTANGNAASSFTVSTAMTGTQTYTATCTQNGCPGPAASFQLTVISTMLTVLHRDADYGNTGNNIIKPYLELANTGGSAIPYGELTVRYWFTAEGNAPPTNLAVYYAQLGAVNMNYVALSQPRQGAYGYVEYSFPGGGSLGGGGNSGPIENGIQKTDGSNFDESDDYSYQANYQDYLPNMHITAYRNGTIVWGQEPTAITSQTAVQVYSQAKDGPTTSQIQTRLELRNTGNVALPVVNLKLRYYFTSDNDQLANVYVDYADIGASNVAARVVKLAAPVGGADSYVELSFPGNTMQVGALSSLGAIDFRLVRSDYGLLEQTNDYSYAANYGNVGLNTHVTAYLNNTLIFGTPPSGAPARVALLESTALLQARVLGNPVVGSQADVEITGAEGQAVNVRLYDLQGRELHGQLIEKASGLEQITVPLGQSRGQLLLKVSTANQSRQVKLVRP